MNVSFSDNLAVLFQIDGCQQNNKNQSHFKGFKTNKTIIKNIIKNINYDLLNEELESYNWDELADKSVDLAFEQFVSKTKDFLNKATSEICYSNKKKECHGPVTP